MDYDTQFEFQCLLLEAPATPKALNTKLTSLTGIQTTTCTSSKLLLSGKMNEEFFVWMKSLFQSTKYIMNLKSSRTKRLNGEETKVRMQILNYEKLKEPIAGIYKSQSPHRSPQRVFACQNKCSFHG